MNTLEKIKAGNIQIVEGKLIGLGANGEESINIEALNDLLEFAGKSRIADTLNETITGIAEIHAKALEMEQSDVLDFLNDYVLEALPDNTSLYLLSKVHKTFSL